MPFTEGNKIGNRFDSENQPKKQGRKQKNTTLQRIMRRLGGRWSDEEMKDILFVALAGGKDDLKELIDDNKTYSMLRALISDMARKGGSKVVNDILDRIYGRATQPNEHTGKDGADLIPSIDVTILSKEQLEVLATIAKSDFKNKEQ